MNELMEKAGGLLPTVLLIAVCFNAVLSALSIVLGKIKDLTVTDADNKAFELVGKILGVFQKIIDFLGNNLPNKK